MTNDELQRKPECSNEEKLTEIFHHSGFVILSSFVIFHNAAGEKHGQSCGAKGIRSGGPVDIVSEGKASLVVGEH
jgi:hypothetical protein